MTTMRIGRFARDGMGLLVAVLTAAAPAAVVAQQAAACSGPGAAFGVTAYQCTSCAIKQGSGIRTQYTFQAEPIVLEASAASVLKPGDVIEAVDGDPIMTRAGADRFTYPAAGPAIITARRGNARVQLNATTLGCADRANAAAAPQPTPRNEPLIIIDGVVQPSAATPPSYYLNGKKVDPLIEDALKRAGYSTERSSSSVDTSFISGNGRKFGFAIGCLPSCTRAKAKDGTEYFKFDDNPPIVALTPGGPAERAGIRMGDRVSQIDGKSILGEEGALRFVRGNKTETLHITVIRDGLPIGYLLKAR